MNRMDILKGLSPKEAGHYMCEAVERLTEDCCETCPVSNLCSEGHNGWVEWLNRTPEEWEERYKEAV